jgi:general secretion pathway protein K
MTRRAVSGELRARRSRAQRASPGYPLSVIGYPPRRQRGVALITAVLIVALATVLAVAVAHRGYLDQRRTATGFALDQAYEVALGGEAWAADALSRDAKQGGGAKKTDDFTEEWATPIPPIPIESGDTAIGEFEGVLEDMQGRFNLNSLVVFENGKYLVHQPAVDQLTRLLDLLDMEDKWAPIIADWLDSDTNEGFPSGAEDSAYTSLTPSYRPANMPITRVSELLSLQDFGLERYRRLEPFVTALPIGTPINLCTAPAEVLDALVDGQVEYTNARDNMTDLRKQRCFPNLDDFKPQIESIAADERQAFTETIGEQSSYFRSTIWVTIGTTQFTLYSLLHRPNSTNLVRPILRSPGSP